MTRDMTFSTAISGRTDQDIELRGTPLTKLIAEANFVATLFFSLTGRKPTAPEERVLNALLVAAIDQGLEPASGFVPRVVASSGNSVVTCMAATLLALGPYHGGAVTGAMEVFELVNGYSDDKESAATWLVKKYRSEKQRVPGFGHSVYKDKDPRTQQLFMLARDAGLALEYMNLALQIEHTIEQETLKKQVINIDGALAALLLAMGIHPSAGNGLFAVARAAGCIAHCIEEQSTKEWVRRLPSSAIRYVPNQSSD